MSTITQKFTKLKDSQVKSSNNNNSHFNNDNNYLNKNVDCYDYYDYYDYNDYFNKLYTLYTIDSWSERMAWLEENIDDKTISKDIGDVIRPMIFNMNEGINFVFSEYHKKPLNSRNQDWLRKSITAVAKAHSIFL